MTVAAAVATLSGVQIRLFGSALIDIPLTLFWIVALINAINWIDNMDGLAAGTAAITSGFFPPPALSQGQILVSMLAAAIFGSAVGFLIYNFNPSSTFMGDMGAYTLGFVLAILAIKLKFAAQPLNVTWMVPIFVLALPIVDINLAIVTRLLERRPLMLAAKDHVSHRLLSLGLTQRQTLALLYLFSFCYGLVALGHQPSATRSGAGARWIGFSHAGLDLLPISRQSAGAEARIRQRGLKTFAEQRHTRAGTACLLDRVASRSDFHMVGFKANHDCNLLWKSVIMFSCYSALEQSNIDPCPESPYPQTPSSTIARTAGA